MYYTLEKSFIKTRLIGIKNKVTRFLFLEPYCTMEPIVFFRIAIGFLCLIHYLSVLTDMQVLFGSTGLIPWEINELYVDDIIPSFNKLANLTQLPEERLFLVFSILYCGLCLLIIFGVYSQISALFLLFFHAVYTHSNVFLTYGVDYFSSMAIFYLIIFPADKMFSLRKSGFNSNENVLIYRRFLQIHLSISYFFSGFDKFLGYNWRNGESIWKAITLPYSNLDFSFNLESFYNYNSIFIIMGWGVIILEMFYFICFWDRIRPYWLIAIVSMHLGIAIILNLYFFSSMMIIWNIAAFYKFPKQVLK